MVRGQYLFEIFRGKPWVHSESQRKSMKKVFEIMILTGIPTDTEFHEQYSSINMSPISEHRDRGLLPRRGFLREGGPAASCNVRASVRPKKHGVLPNGFWKCYISGFRGKGSTDFWSRFRKNHKLSAKPTSGNRFGGPQK